MRLIWRSLWLVWCLTGLAPVGAQTSVTVVLVTSDRSAPMAGAAEALITQLERGGLSRYQMLQLTAAEFEAAGPLNPKLFVALGSEAASVLAKSDLRAPVLCALLPRLSFERVLRLSGKKQSPQFSALYLDQPLSRQLALIQLALPQARRIGVLWGPESHLQAGSLRLAAQARGLALVEASVGPDSTFFKGLKSVLEESDVMLALADPQVYNTNSIQNILLTSFRARVPLVAFSPAYVRAGALLALHVTPEQVGRQAAAIVGPVLQGKALPAVPVYSQEFTVAVNVHVARALDLMLDGPDLGERLRLREVAP
jgi:putative ABC transport system substrate-binding protein